MLHNFMPAAREAGMTMKEYRDSPQNIAVAHIQACEKYDLDGVFIDIDTATMAGALGAAVDYPEDDPARIHDSSLTRLEDVRDLQIPSIERNERIQIWAESCRLVKQHFGDEKFIRGNCDQLPFSVASMLRGPANWMMDLRACL
jgi:uroporphyrinogen decarboxylase